MTKSQYDLTDVPLKKTVHLCFRFRGSNTVWDEYFPPTNYLSRVSIGNNPQEQAQNLRIARGMADDFRRKLEPLAEVWEVF